MQSGTSPDLVVSLAQFCAQVMASTTHEIKNHLAVMNEQGHLAQEMLALGRQGREPDLGRLEELMGRVLARLDQADQVVRRLDALAQTSEGEPRSADLAQALATMLPIFNRIAVRRQVTLQAPEAPAQAVIAAPPVLLEALVWACLEAVTAAATPESEIAISLEPGAGEVVLALWATLEGEPARPPEPVLAALGASLKTCDPGGLAIALPIAA